MITANMVETSCGLPHGFLELFFSDEDDVSYFIS